MGGGICHQNSDKSIIQPHHPVQYTYFSDQSLLSPGVKNTDPLGGSQYISKICYGLSEYMNEVQAKKTVKILLFIPKPNNDVATMTGGGNQ